MTTKNVKYNYDSTINRKSHSEDSHPADPGMIFDDISVEKIDLNGRQVLKMDVSELLENVKNVIEQWEFPQSIDYKKMNGLQKLEYGLSNYRNIHKSYIIQFVGKISFSTILNASNNQIKTIGQWFMHSENYRNLTITERIQILKSTWAQWKRLERFATTAKLLGHRMIDENIVTVMPGKVARAGELKVTCDFFTVNEMKGHFNVYNLRMMEEVAKPLVELAPSNREIAFMLAYMSWHFAGKKYQGKILEASEIELKQLSNDLHSYYMNEQKIKNYAARVVKIMKIINAVLKIHFDRLNLMDILRLFDLSGVEATDPEIYQTYF
ncbi:unnamed protein product [Caenorhabditis bovis]|uniref:NR LBD domain-containing protein n=1 Tax=Caenorhabditis bovis TaxID=2654633 RepID=A0A8S1E924_9PELO|nr:unnamed protein product [Caenorhabditis bovis]